MPKSKPARYDVAFYVPWIGPLLAPGATRPTGGAETQVFLLAQALQRRGASVCLIAFAIPDVEIPAHIHGIDVQVRRPYLGGRGPIARIAELAAIWRAVARVDAAVVVARAAGPHVGVVGVAARAHGRRFVYSAASAIDLDYSRSAAKSRDRLLFRLGVAVASCVVVQTFEQCEAFRRGFGRMTVRIPSVAESARAPRGRPTAFLWYGRLDANKRPWVYLDLAEALPEAAFWMVGVPAPSPADLSEEIARRAESIPNLTLLPPRSRSAMVALLSDAVAVVNTSQAEGFPNAFLEAWAHGVPALSLGVDPDGVIVSEGLGHVARGEFEVLVSTARTVWQGRTDLADLSARCSAYVRSMHSPAHVAAEWARALEISEDVLAPAMTRTVAE